MSWQVMWHTQSSHCSSEQFSLSLPLLPPPYLSLLPSSLSALWFRSVLNFGFWRQKGSLETTLSILLSCSPLGKCKCFCSSTQTFKHLWKWNPNYQGVWIPRPFPRDILETQCFALSQKKRILFLLRWQKHFFCSSEVIGWICCVL